VFLMVQMLSLFAGIHSSAVSLGSTWSYALPLSKPLWTGSYVCLVTGLAMFMLALLH
jgi:predicted acyltransferase